MNLEKLYQYLLHKVYNGKHEFPHENQFEGELTLIKAGTEIEDIGLPEGEFSEKIKEE